MDLYGALIKKKHERVFTNIMLMTARDENQARLLIEAAAEKINYRTGTCQDGLPVYKCLSTPTKAAANLRLLIANLLSERNDDSRQMRFSLFRKMCTRPADSGLEDVYASLSPSEREWLTDHGRAALQGEEQMAEIIRHGEDAL
jgi:hypothetical protein